MREFFKRWFRDYLSVFSELPLTIQKIIKLLIGLGLAWLIGGLILGLLFMATCKGETGAMEGEASWYGGGEPLNKYTASGEVFDPGALVCACWDWPLGAYLRVVNLQNGYSVVVRVNDRGPAKRLHRLIDLSRRAFSEIAPLKEGVIKVKVEVYDSGYGG